MKLVEDGDHDDLHPLSAARSQDVKTKAHRRASLRCSLLQDYSSLADRMEAGARRYALEDSSVRHSDCWSSLDSLRDFAAAMLVGQMQFYTQENLLGIMCGHWSRFDIYFTAVKGHNSLMLNSVEYWSSLQIIIIKDSKEIWTKNVKCYPHKYNWPVVSSFYLYFSAFAIKYFSFALY